VQDPEGFTQALLTVEDVWRSDKYPDAETAVDLGEEIPD
jgi:hypothetical protein